MWCRVMSSNAMMSCHVMSCCWDLTFSMWTQVYVSSCSIYKLVWTAMASCPQKLLSEYLTMYMYEVTHHMLTFSSDRFQFKHCIVWWLTAVTISVCGICIMTGFMLKPHTKWLQDSFTGFSEIQGPWAWFSATVGFFTFLLIHLITDLSCSLCSRSPPTPHPVFHCLQYTENWAGAGNDATYKRILNMECTAQSTHSNGALKLFLAQHWNWWASHVWEVSRFTTQSLMDSTIVILYHRKWIFVVYTLQLFLDNYNLKPIALSTSEGYY